MGLKCGVEGFQVRSFHLMQLHSMCMEYLRVQRKGGTNAFEIIAGAQRVANWTELNQRHLRRNGSTWGWHFERNSLANRYKLQMSLWTGFEWLCDHSPTATSPRPMKICEPIQGISSGVRQILGIFAEGRPEEEELGTSRFLFSAICKCRSVPVPQFSFCVSEHL